MASKFAIFYVPSVHSLLHSCCRHLIAKTCDVAPSPCRTIPFNRFPLPSQDPATTALPPLPARPARVDPSDPASAGPGLPAQIPAGGLSGKGGEGPDVVGRATSGGDGSVITSSEEEAEVVDEVPLPELYVPGRIVHIYR